MTPCYRFSMLAPLTFFFSTLIGVAQQPTPYEVQGTATHRKTDNFNGDNLTIQLTDLPTGKDWVIGVRVDSKPQIELIATSVVMDRASGAYDISSMSRIDDNLDRTSPNEIKFHGLGSLQGYFCMLLKIPAGVHLKVEAAGSEYFSGTPSAGLFIKNGRLLPRTPYAIGDVLMLLKNGWPNASVTQTANGRSYVTTPEALLDHMISATLPTPTGLNGMATVSVRIDTSGSVVEVTPIRGDETLVSAAEQAIRGWKFRPFEFSGKKVPVVSSVMFLFEGDKVISSLQENPIMSGYNQ